MLSKIVRQTASNDWKTKAIQDWTTEDICGYALSLKLDDLALWIKRRHFTFPRGWEQMDAMDFAKQFPGTIPTEFRSFLTSVKGGQSTLHQQI